MTSDTIRSGVIRSGLIGVLLTGLFVMRLQADLSTRTGLSIEWLVDSSDAIYEVRISAPTQQNKTYVVKRESQLKKPSSIHEVEQCEKSIDQWQIPTSAGLKESDILLVFLRTWENTNPTMVKYINLSRPLERSSSAAITSEGVPLSDKVQILRVVNERVLLSRQLTSRARQLREIADGRKLSGAASHVHFLAGTNLFIENYIGGMRFPIGCDLWDNPDLWRDKSSQFATEYRVEDEDMYLDGIIVPADPKYHRQLLEAVESSDLFNGQACRYLVNYPGKETEQVLKDLATSTSRNGSEYANEVLWYFKFRHDLSDPLNKNLVGRWRLVGKQERIDLTLDDDNTFVASAFAPPQKEGEKEIPLWQGEGYWFVRDQRFTIWRKMFKHPKVGWTYGERTIFEDKRVVETSQDKVVLEGGPTMLRTPTERSTKLTR